MENIITHDLGVVANMADRIAIMYAGKIVEYGTADDVFYDPRHPYTWALLSSMPDLETREKLEAIPGTPPDMILPPKGDAFAARNKYAMEIDFEEQPPMFHVSETHMAATWLLHPNAPKVNPPAIVVERIERMKKEQAEREAAEALQNAKKGHQRDSGQPFIPGNGHAHPVGRFSGHPHKLFRGNVGGNQGETHQPPGQTAAGKEIV